MFGEFFLALLIAVWLLIGTFSYNVLKKAFKKYQKYKPIPNLDEKYDGLVRVDFRQWNRQKIAIGCFTLVPLRIFLFASLLPIGFVFVFLAKIFGYASIICSAYFYYISTFGRFVTNLLCNTKLQFRNRDILTPIVISNHVNWFDIFAIAFHFSPISFLAKKQVKNWPIFGAFGRLIQCVFLSRQSETARNEAKQLIKRRIQDFNSFRKDTYPLLIFPQGTTSNNKGLLTFKSGAFDNMSSITAFCLKYQCQNFSLGLDQIDQIQHVFLMMSQLATLKIKRLQFEPNIGETVEQYQQRCRSQMSKALGIPCTAGGYRDSLVLNNMRKENKDE